jgi:hypothetical protein
MAWHLTAHRRRHHCPARGGVGIPAIGALTFILGTAVALVMSQRPQLVDCNELMLERSAWKLFKRILRLVTSTRNRFWRCDLLRVFARERKAILWQVRGGG